MPLPLTNDAEAFYRFLGEQLHVGPPTKSPEELVGEWRQQREYRESIAAIEEGVRDMEAGRMRSVRELLQEATQRGESR